MLVLSESAAAEESKDLVLQLQYFQAPAHTLYKPTPHKTAHLLYFQIVAHTCKNNGRCMAYSSLILSPSLQRSAIHLPPFQPLAHSFFKMAGVYSLSFSRHSPLVTRHCLSKRGKGAESVFQGFRRGAWGFWLVGCGVFGDRVGRPFCAFSCCFFRAQILSCFLCSLGFSELACTRRGNA
jgi:hypothetical protein